MNTNEVLESWQVNAAEWIKTLEGDNIASRKVTNPAIFDTIKGFQPSSILDLGCGEGWLTRTLNQTGIKAVGIDGTNPLIEVAKSKGGGDFFVQSYEEIIYGKKVMGAPYEAVVFNFCLYLKEETPALLTNISSFLEGRKLVFIQTLHPYFAITQGIDYRDQWLDDAWKGLHGGFTSPHRWYYRTMAGWMETIADSGLKVLSIEEPLVPGGTRPASVIFTLTSIS